MLTIGTTPLLRAAKGLDAPAIELLLKHGANPNLPNTRGITPVMAAAGLGSIDADTRGCSPPKTYSSSARSHRWNCC